MVCIVVNGQTLQAWANMNILPRTVAGPFPVGDEVNEAQANGSQNPAAAGEPYLFELVGDGNEDEPFCFLSLPTMTLESSMIPQQVAPHLWNWPPRKATPRRRCFTKRWCERNARRGVIGL